MRCELCETEDGHRSGCPNGAEEEVTCGHCDQDLPISQLADHMNEVHGSQLDRDDLEQQFVGVKEIMRESIDRAQRALRLLTPLTEEQVWAAIGFERVTGDWPRNFDPGAALIVAMERYADLASRHQALTEAFADERLLEAIDLTSMETPEGFEFTEGHWQPHCPYNDICDRCDRDGHCPRAPQ